MTWLIVLLMMMIMPVTLGTPRPKASGMVKSAKPASSIVPKPTSKAVHPVSARSPALVGSGGSSSSGGSRAGGGASSAELKATQEENQKLMEENQRLNDQVCYKPEMWVESLSSFIAIILYVWFGV